MINPLKSPFALFASAIALLGAPALRAQVLTFTVDINTAGLSGDAANAPFDLDLTSAYDGTNPTSTVTLSNFVFTGGSSTGAAVITGAATGSETGSVTLTSSAAHTFSDLYQQFTAGTTNIQFTATVTEPGPNVGTPNEFSVSILDDALGSPAQITTTAPDTQSLVTLDLRASNTIANVNTYQGIASADGNTPLSNISASVSPIPEPSTYAAILGGVAALYAVASRRAARNRAV